MNKKVMLIFSLTILAITITISGSGCIDPNDASGTTEVLITADLIVVQDIPTGFEYLGALPESETLPEVKSKYVETSDSIISAREGFYRDSGNDDTSIMVIECTTSDAAESLVTEHKSQFKSLMVGQRFVEDQFNEHSVVRITDYRLFDSEQVPSYSYVWSNEKFVFIVKGNTADYILTRTLAEATGQ